MRAVREFEYLRGDSALSKPVVCSRRALIGAGVASLSLVSLGCSDRGRVPVFVGGASKRPVLRASEAPAGEVAPGAPPTDAPLAGRPITVEGETREQVRGHTATSHTAVRWNALARELVASERWDLLSAARLYAVLGVAQHDAAFFARLPRSPASGWLAAGSATDSRARRHACERAAIAAASRIVLAHFFPGQAIDLSRRCADLNGALRSEGLSTTAEIEAGQQGGGVVGHRVLAHVARDGAAEALVAPADTGGARAGRAVWAASFGRTPLGARWGTVRPWVLGDVSRFRAPPPPPLSSAAFAEARAEVRRLSDGRTLEQRRIAALWADGPGSYTPPGRWNKIAADLVVGAALSEAQAVRVFAVVHMALMDAGIACWDTKFHYMVPRPSQLDPFITTPVGLPEFPSYTSAHAAFSGAAAGVLAELFPGTGAFVDAKAQEASLSRIYGGIHYRFDADAGLAQGRKVAQAALAWDRSTDGSGA